MKKLLFSSLMAMLMLTPSLSLKANTNYQISVVEWEDFYKHLGAYIKYPSKAVDAEVQGNSLITFTVSKGKLKDLKVQKELGYDCDTEVLNRILSFPKFAEAKDGNYALKTKFKLGDHNGEVKNADLKMPTGYTALEIVIVGFSPKSNVSTSATQGKINHPEKKSLLEIRGINKEIPGNVLIVLNGEVLENSNLNVINPDQIESLDILKDASAISKYGYKGKNGVIIVTTKKTKPALGGSVMGLSIKKTDASETKANVVVRGEKTWGKENPLIVINGEIADLKNIAPENVESISVVKDASSTALYGDKGKNGVVIITTKKETATVDPSENEGKTSGIIIRGNGIANEPLYVVDGEIVEDISAIAPDNIKEISVIKSANGTLPYGEKGKNGVIEIKTKKGKVTVIADPIKNEDKDDKKSSIIIKGNNAEMGLTALYVVDGEIANDVSSLDPDSIDDVYVVQGQKAISTYGDKGKKGAIVITTKEAAKKDGSKNKSNDK